MVGPELRPAWRWDRLPHRLTRWLRTRLVRLPSSARSGVLTLEGHFSAHTGVEKLSTWITKETESGSATVSFSGVLALGPQAAAGERAGLAPVPVAGNNEICHIQALVGLSWETAFGRASTQSGNFESERQTLGSLYLTPVTAQS